MLIAVVIAVAGYVAFWASAPLLREHMGGDGDRGGLGTSNTLHNSVLGGPTGDFVS